LHPKVRVYLQHFAIRKSQDGEQKNCPASQVHPRIDDPLTIAGSILAVQVETTIPTSRIELQRQVTKLDQNTLQINRRYPDPSDYISEFSGHADSITDRAGPDDYEWAVAELDRILTKHGHPPELNEFPPDESGILAY
jgi:hypothetical protein